MDKAFVTGTVSFVDKSVVIHRHTLFFRTSTLHHGLDSRVIIAKKTGCDKGFSGFFNSPSCKYCIGLWITWKQSVVVVGEVIHKKWRARNGHSS